MGAGLWARVRRRDSTIKLHPAQIPCELILCPRWLVHAKSGTDSELNFIRGASPGDLPLGALLRKTPRGRDFGEAEVTLLSKQSGG